MRRLLSCGDDCTVMNRGIRLVDVVSMGESVCV